MPDSERSGRIVFAVPEEPHAYMTRLRGASNGGSHMQYWFGERGSAVGTPSARRWVANVFRVTTRCFSLTKHRWPMSGSGCSPGEPPTWISTNNVEEATKLCRRARVEGTPSIPSHSLTRGLRQTFTAATNQRDAGQRGRAMLTRWGPVTQRSTPGSAHNLQARLLFALLLRQHQGRGITSLFNS